MKEYFIHYPESIPFFSNKIYITEDIDKKIGDVKKDDPFSIKFINFFLLRKLASKYILYLNNLSKCDYVKLNKRERKIVWQEFNKETKIYFKKVGGDKFFSWDYLDNTYILRTKFNTSVSVIKGNEKMVNIEILSNIPRKDLIRFEFLTDDHEIFPIVSLIYLNEIYYNR